MTLLYVRKNKKRKNKINIHKKELDPEAGKGNETLN